jgi:hypothetical protein
VDTDVLSSSSAPAEDEKGRDESIFALVRSRIAVSVIDRPGDAMNPDESHRYRASAGVTPKERGTGRGGLFLIHHPTGLVPTSVGPFSVPTSVGSASAGA